MKDEPIAAWHGSDLMHFDEVTTNILFAANNHVWARKLDSVTRVSTNQGPAAREQRASGLFNSKKMLAIVNMVIITSSTGPIYFALLM